MTSLKRIEATVRFQSVDRPPVIPQIFGHSAILNKVPLGRYVRDGNLIAECQIKALQRYGHDAVFALMDVCVETEAIGSELIYRENIYPAVKSHILDRVASVDSLHVPNPYKDGRMPELLRATTILRERLKDQVLVVGCVLGPMTLAVQLAGMQRALDLAIDQPDYFEKLLDFAVEVIIGFATAQIRAGAHIPMVFDPSASPTVIPALFFRELIMPRLQRIFSAVKSQGAIANWLHITGQTDAILPLYKEMGIDIANIDYCVEPSKAMELLPNICLEGNIKPLLFVDATAEEIYKESRQLINLFAKRGGFILSSGCEIPPEAKPENIEAMIKAVKVI